MRRVSQEVQVWELAVGSAMRVLVHDGVADRPRHVHKGRAMVQRRAGGRNAELGFLKVDERLGEHAIKRSFRVRARGLHNDVAQGPLLRLERPVAAVAGVNINDETMVAAPARGARLHINVSEASSSTPAAGCVTEPPTDQLRPQT